MQLKFLSVLSLALGLLSGAHASSLVVTTDTLLAAATASAESSSDASSSLRDSKLVQAARDDAASFIASAGAIRGARLEAALRHIRSQDAQLAGRDDQQLAQAILSR